MTKNNDLNKTIDYTGQSPNTDILNENTAATSSQLDYQIVKNKEPYSQYKSCTSESNDGAIDEELVKEISNFNYKAVLTPAL